MADVPQIRITEKVQLIEKDAEIAALRNRNLVLAQLLDNAEQANAVQAQTIYDLQAENAKLNAKLTGDTPEHEPAQPPN